jgi:hypothetical protein
VARIAQELLRHVGFDDMAAIREDHATGDVREAHVMRDAEVRNASAIIISRKLTQSRRAAADHPYLCRILVRVVRNLHASEAQCIAGSRASLHDTLRTRFRASMKFPGSSYYQTD